MYYVVSCEILEALRILFALGMLASWFRMKYPNIVVG